MTFQKLTRLALDSRIASELLVHTYTEHRSPLCVVVGPNASGKSLFRRIIQARSKEQGMRCDCPSMEFRATSGFQRAFIMLGSEDEDSTGQLSVQVMQGFFNMLTKYGLPDPENPKEKPDKEPLVLFSDEPDIGLSEGYSIDIGAKLVSFMAQKSPKVVGVYVVSHSRSLLRELLPLNPSLLYFGSDKGPTSLQAWLDMPVVRLDMDKLPDKSMRLHMDVENLMHKIREERAKEREAKEKAKYGDRDENLKDVMENMTGGGSDEWDEEGGYDERDGE